MNTERLKTLAAAGDADASAELARYFTRQSDIDGLRWLAYRVAIGGGWTRWSRTDRPDTLLPPYALGDSIPPWLLDTSPATITLDQPVRVEALWDSQLALAFACDCAEHVMGHLTARYPDDKAPQRAIRAVRRYLQGESVDIMQHDFEMSALNNMIRRDEASARGEFVRLQISAAQNVAYAILAILDGIDKPHMAHLVTESAGRAASDAAGDGAFLMQRALTTERTWQGKRLLAYMFDQHNNGDES